MLSDAVGFVEHVSREVTGTAQVKFTAAFSDGNTLYAVRYASDGQAPTLFAAPVGSAGGYCLVSEPLNDDKDAWVEIPAGSAVIVGEDGLDAAAFDPTWNAESIAAE